MSGPPSGSPDRPRAPTAAAPAHDLGPMPERRLVRTVDERVVRSAAAVMVELARDVERWPVYLPHYRYVRFRERDADGGGLVEMSANRPFGALNWPTWWLSRMQVRSDVDGGRGPAIRFRHLQGVTAGMEVEWSFVPQPEQEAVLVRIVHLWDGPRWPVVGRLAARRVIGPLFVHGIASRTLAGLGAVAEGRHATHAPKDGDSRGGGVDR